MEMKKYQSEFLSLAVASEALNFGQFTLKSGRVSPYFFNAGVFKTGSQLAAVGRCYASAFMDSGIEADALFGPAYKGIPLVAATAISLSENHGKDMPFSYNRKEAKDHGEGGVLVGADLKGKRVVIIDDVITAGTAIREAIDLIGRAGGKAVGVVVCLDRQEKGTGDVSALMELQEQYGLQVVSIVALEQVVSHVASTEDESLHKHLDALKAYQAAYGISHTAQQ